MQYLPLNNLQSNTEGQPVGRYFKPTSEEAIFNQNYWRRKALVDTDSLIENAPLYDDLTVRENMEQFSGCQKKEPKKIFK